MSGFSPEKRQACAWGKWFLRQMAPPFLPCVCPVLPAPTVWRLDHPQNPIISGSPTDFGECRRKCPLFPSVPDVLITVACPAAWQPITFPRKSLRQHQSSCCRKEPCPGQLSLTLVLKSALTVLFLRNCAEQFLLINDLQNLIGSTDCPMMLGQAS